MAKKKGKITKVIKEKKFFFVDNDYWCHFNSFEGTPNTGDIVEYDPVIKNGRKNAENVRKVSEIEEYLGLISSGYFADENFNLKPELIVLYPRKLAGIFQRNENKNKTSQVYNFFQNCRKIESIYKIKKDFNYVKTELSKLIPQIHKAYERGNLSSEFLEFFEKNYEEAILSPEHFTKGFMNHFEAILGFYKHK